MGLHLNVDKAIQAAGVLLRGATRHEMSYLRLLKLLYIADRESLGQIGKPITGDAYYAMDHGPVLSDLYDLIKGRHLRSGQWSRFIDRENYQVQLLEDPGNGELSRYEVAKLEEVWDRHAQQDDWHIVEEVLHQFPEWQNNRPSKGSSKEIPLIDVLQAVGRGEEIDQITADSREDAAMEQVLGKAG